MTDWWLSYWVSNEKPVNVTNATIHNLTNVVLWLPTLHFDNSITYYMVIYGVFVAMNSLFTLFRAFLFAYGGIQAATKIHKNLLRVIVKVRKK